MAYVTTNFLKLQARKGKPGPLVLLHHSHSGNVHTRTLLVAAEDTKMSRAVLLSDHYQGVVKVLVAQLCLTLCVPMDHSPRGFSDHGILQARTLEWVAISFSRASS